MSNLELRKKMARKFLPEIERAFREWEAPAGGKNWITLPVLIALVDRETLWTTARAYVLPDGRQALGRPDGRGDLGHGHGLFQIDDRSHQQFIKTGKWKEPYYAARYALDLLASNYRYLERQVRRGALGDTELYPIHRLWSGALAAYNCGCGNVTKSWKRGQPEDTRTAGGDYSRDVMTRMRETWALFCASCGCQAEQ